jgi:hypothetical protein
LQNLPRDDLIKAVNYNSDSLATDALITAAISSTCPDKRSGLHMDRLKLLRDKTGKAS